MEDLSLGRIAALVPEFAVKDMPFGRIQMIHTHTHTHTWYELFNAVQKFF